MNRTDVTICRRSRAFARVLGLALLAGLLLLSGRAHALSFRHVTDADVKSLVSRLVAEASTSRDSGDFKSTIELAVRVRPIVEMSDAKCPMPLTVTNATDRPFFNVKITTSERRGASGSPTKTVFHLPYLPAKSSVSGTVVCSLKSPLYGYGGGGGDIYLSASPIAEHSHLDEDGIHDMAQTAPDATTGGYSFTAGGGSALAGLGDSPPSTSEDDDDSLPTTGDPAIDEILRKSRAARTKGTKGTADAGAGKADAGAGKGSTASKPSSASSDEDDSPLRKSIIGTILQDVESDADFKLFATAVLRSADGAREIGRFVNRFPGSPPVASLTPLLATAPAARVATLLASAMRDDDPRSRTFLSAAVTRVCAPGQPEDVRTSTWLSALAPGVNNVAAREAVLAKCGGSKEQMRARLKSAKGEQLGRALEGMEGDLFGIAVKAMVDSKSRLAAEELLRNTQSATKFDAVAAAAASFITPAEDRQELLRRVASGKSGALDATKAQWLDGQLVALHASHADQEALREIIDDMAGGLVANAAVRKVVVAHRADAGPKPFEAFRPALSGNALVLSPDWVMKKTEAGELDIVDVVSKVQTASTTSTTASRYGGSYGSTTPTVGCQSSSANALACLGAVEDLAPKADAIDPAFVTAAVGFVRSTPSDEKAVTLLEKLSSLGVDVSDAVTALCSAAPTSPGRYGYGSGAADPLRSAIKLGAGNACVANVTSQRASAARWIYAGMGVRFVLAFVPFAFVALLARKRFVPVRSQLAKENAELEQVRGKAALMTRLEAPRGDDGIASGLADAARFLVELPAAAPGGAEAYAGQGGPSDELAAAGRALMGLTPELRAGIVMRQRTLASRAAETGAVATCLCALDGLALYLACFPGREDQPQTVRRQPGFADGFPAHMSALLEACAADGKPRRILSLVTMLRTDGTRMTMLVGYDSDTVHLVPESLAGEPAPGVDVIPRTHEHRYEISQLSPQNA